MRNEVLYGRQPVAEAIRAGRRQVLRLYVSPAVRASPEFEGASGEARRRRVDIVTVDSRRLDALTGGGHHQGIAAEVTSYPYFEFDDMRSALGKLGAEPGLVLLLDHVQDPQNLGAILRVAEAAGVHGVVIPSDRACHVTPAAVRASAGAAEHVRVSVVTNLPRSMKSLQDDGLWLAGLESRQEAKSHTETALDGPLGLVVGSEGRGLSRLVCESCDFLIRLPMRGHVNSLNVASATAVALYEILRQRQRPNQ